MSNIRKHIESSKTADYMRKYEEYQRTLDHAALYNTTCINKYKDIHEEAFFLNEVTIEYDEHQRNVSLNFLSLSSRHSPL